MKLQENEHYYYENGLLVFTAKYHLERGYCCKNGCRHCPYGFKKEVACEQKVYEKSIKPDDK